MNCVSCRTGLDHCHGTLMWHADGGTECTGVACGDVDAARHSLAIDCSSVDGVCPCAEYVPAQGELSRV